MDGNYESIPLGTKITSINTSANSYVISQTTTASISASSIIRFYNNTEHTGENRYMKNHGHGGCKITFKNLNSDNNYGWGLEAEFVYGDEIATQAGKVYSTHSEDLFLQQTINDSNATTLSNDTSTCTYFDTNHPLYDSNTQVGGGWKFNSYNNNGDYRTNMFNIREIPELLKALNGWNASSNSPPTTGVSYENQSVNMNKGKSII